jgi:short-subunit dehydrogenase
VATAELVAALRSDYGGTKAFVLAFSRSLHKEFAEKNIRFK